MKFRAPAELLADAFEEVPVRQVVAGAAQEEHGDSNRVKMLGTLGLALTRLMQWKGEEHETVHAI